MRCLPRAPIPRFLLALCTALVSACAVAADPPPEYDAAFHAELLPAEGVAVASVKIDQRDGEVSELRFRIEEGRHHDFDGDGELEVEPPFVYWRPPADGGRFSLRVHIDRERRGNGKDAHIDADWAILRLDHLFPAARVRGRPGATSRSTLSLAAPEDWSVETRYGRFDGEPLPVETSGRRYSRPTGWIAAGQLGVRRESIAGRGVTVAGPVQQGVRRMDHLALMQWTLPTLLEVFPAFPESVLVVSAGDPMWRGALSGPSSLYIHAERPLINERGTSTLLHELVHVAGISGTGTGAAWIVEGLADYYSLEALRRSGAVTDARHERSRAALERQGRDVSRLDTRRANAEVSARAVTVLYMLDAAIRDASGGEANLDDVARALAESDETITLARFRTLAEQTAGATLALFDDLPLRKPAPPSRIE